MALHALLWAGALAANSAQKFYNPNTDLDLWPDAVCRDFVFTTPACSCKMTLHGARVVVQEGLEPGSDVLECGECARYGVTADFDPSVGILTMSGDQSMDDYTKAIASVTFRTAAANGRGRRLSYNFGEAIYSTDIGRFYEFFPCQGGDCSWTAAQTWCADKEHDVLGLAGYLATLTSTRENTAVHYLHPRQSGWIGGADVGKEGEWRWVTGPEGCPPYNLAADGPERTACRLGFPLAQTRNPCTGNQCGKGALIGNGQGASFDAPGYAHWAAAEPDERADCAPDSCAAAGEDYMYMERTGLWADLSHTTSEATGFICEWGGAGMGTLCMEEPDGEMLLRAGCDGYLQAGTCNAARPAGGCEWDGTCNLAGCQKYTYARDCNHDKECVFDVSFATKPAACVKEKCNAVHVSSATCSADKECRWNARENKCEPLICYQLTDKCDCLEHLPECDWIVDDPDRPHCGPTLRCPESDMLFLVPGTPKLSGRFGSYLKGHDGMLESFRHWEKYSELSASAEMHTGVRLTYVTYGRDGVVETSQVAEPQSFKQACKQATWEAPPGPGTGGAFSGDRDTLGADLDFHESMYCEEWAESGTYLAPGLDKARELFQASPANRAKYVFIVTDTPFADPAAAAAARDALMATGVKVFGIVIRPTEASDAADQAAEKSLRAMVTASADEHVINVAMDDLEPKALMTICDPHELFGRQIFEDGDVPPPCDELNGKEECEGEKGKQRCQYSVLTGMCDVSECHPLCTADTCNAKFGCKWNAGLAGGMCEPEDPKCEEKMTAGECGGEELCVWNPSWGTGCQLNPCIYQNGQKQACQASFVNIKDCTAPMGDPEYCQVRVCEYDDTQTVSCFPKDCVSLTEAKCTQDDSCIWDPKENPLPAGPPSKLADYCRKDRCPNDLGYFSCEAGERDLYCEYTFRGGCQEKACGTHVDEAECNHDAKCKFDTVAQGCVEQPCAFVTDCQKSEDCMLDYKNDCVEKTCKKYSDKKCECTSDPECVWVSEPTIMPAGGYCVRPELVSCPDVDIAMLLDGSGSMSAQFGSHPHGFYGLCEILRSWVIEAPLTGDDHTRGADASRGGFRVTFLQFSRADATPAMDHPTNCGIGLCTDGLLSGRLDELAGDLDWHEANYQSGWTYLHVSLLDVAEHAFLPENSPAWRKHIAMVFADGGLTDYDGDACCGACDRQCWDREWRQEYRTSLTQAEQLLKSENVQTYGVIVTRYPQATFQDDNAYKKLAPLVTKPEDTHILKAFMDDLKEQILDTLCDPTSPFGSNLVDDEPGNLICNGWALEDECNADNLCQWTEPQKMDCATDKGCPGLGCRPVPPEFANQGFTCDNCKLERTKIECGAGIVPNTGGFCDNTKCLSYCTEKDCRDDPECTYNSDSDQCEKIVCDTLPEMECKEKPICEFKDGSKCQKRQCVSVFEETKCVEDSECYFDKSVSPAMCRKTPKCDVNDGDKAACDQDPLCTYNCTSNVCMDTLCPYATMDACVVDMNCEWTGAGCFLKRCVNMFAQSPGECKDCDGCRWNDATMQCEDNHCKPLGQADCDMDATCKWDGDKCINEPCADYAFGPDAEKKCEADDRCDFKTDQDPAACVPNPCADDDCNKDVPSDSKVPRCKSTTDMDGDFCMPRECGNAQDSCFCNAIDGCFWDEASLTCKEEDLAHCPDMDVAVLLDGSTLMGEAFGQHPHGYHALVETMRDWANLLPLSQEPGPAATKVGGVSRITFRQYGAAGAGLACADASCAQGAPTGALAEADAGLDWQSANFGGDASRSLGQALVAASDSLEANAAAGRLKVIFVVTGGAISDANTIDAQRQQVLGRNTVIFGAVVRKSATRGADAQGGEATLASVVSAPASDHMESVPLEGLLETLRNFCNPGSKLGGVLQSFNAAQAQAATQGTLPCQYWGDSTECRADGSCEFVDAPGPCANAGGCPQLNCLELTKEQVAGGFTCANCELFDGKASCKAGNNLPEPAGRCQEGKCAGLCFGDCFMNPECKWTPDDKTCAEKPCADVPLDECDEDPVCKIDPMTMECVKDPCVAFTKGACEKSEECKWDGDKCFEKNPDCTKLDEEMTCVAHPSGVCEWDCSVAQSGCKNSKCPFEKQGECTGADCVWEEDKCREKRCHTAGTEAECTQDAVCVWDGASCAENECYKHSHETTCQDDARCEWDAQGCGACMVSRCTKLHPTQVGCGDVPGELCRWDADAKACVDMKCKDYNDPSIAGPDGLCDCRSNPKCIVDTRVGGAVCIPREYQACPDLDVMIAFGGSCSMQARFGRHSNGAEALMAGLRAWAQEVPLTNEAANEASTDAGTRSLRVALAQQSRGVRVAECANCACMDPPPAQGDGVPTWSGVFDMAAMSGKADTCGAFTGKAAELDVDLQWHTQAGCKDGNTLLETYRQAADRFRAAPTTRKRVLIVLTDGEVRDTADLAMARDELSALGVLRFGVHVYGRRGQSPVAADLAERDVLAAAIDGEVQQLTVDEALAQIKGLCDQETPFGVQIADPATERRCDQLTVSRTCREDRRCLWNAITTACEDHPCVTHCGEVDCVADMANNCAFDADSAECGKTLCEEVGEPDKCKELKCRWDAGKTPPCEVTECPAETEDDCWLLPNACEWQEREDGASCEEIPCNHDDEATCAAAAECEWAADVCGGSCVAVRCSAADMQSPTACQADEKCEWTAALTCVPAACTTIRDEKCCEDADGCSWTITTSPGTCIPEPCGPLDAKKDDPECKECEDLDRCECKNSADCYFSTGLDRCVSTEMALCPDMDLVVMVDANRNMKEEFGRHPHGFNAVLELVREFGGKVPLTNQAAGAMPAGDGSTVGVVQFSGQAAAEGYGTPLTGEEAALVGALDDHAGRYAGLGRMIAKGLEIAGDTFDPQHQPGPAGRQRVVLVFLNAATTDDAAAVNNKLAILRNEGAAILGVQLRRQTVMTDADRAAVAELERYTQNAGKVQSLQMKEVYENVFLDLCNPAGKFGQHVAEPAKPPQPCFVYTDAPTCNMDEGCVYDSASLTCVANECSKRCDETECVKPLASTAPVPPTCMWDGENCWQEKKCQKKNEMECNDAVECEWVPGTGCIDTPCVPNENEQECAQDALGCDWVPSQTPSCVKACDYTEQGVCEGHEECEWGATECSGGAQVCYRKAPNCAEYTDADACVTTPLPAVCMWDAAASTCVDDPCGPYRHDEQCCLEAPLACDFDVKGSPATCRTEPCSRKGSKDECEVTGECDWDESAMPAVCKPLDCDGKDGCDCQQTADCFWMESPPPAQCVNEDYSLCPATDYAVVVDGTSVMGESFSRHPQGFYAVVAALKEWAGDLPLTGEAAGTGMTSSVDLSRATFVQYTGVRDTRAQALTPAVGTGTAGRLSGDAAEVLADLDWHAEHFVGGDGMIKEGLAAAAEALKGAAPGRRRAVIVIAGAEFFDSADLGAARSDLAAANAAMFGVVVRRGAASTQVDTDAEAVLKPLLSTPAEAHFVNIEVDELLATLKGLCDPNAEWGRRLLAAPGADVSGRDMPCTYYVDKANCDGNMRCAWSEATTTCADSPCVELCEEMECNANVANNCTWNAAQNGCERFPTPDTDCECADGTTNPVYNEQVCTDNPKCMWDATAMACKKDDCKENVGEGWITCSGADQQCVDDDLSPCEAGWRCECTPPAQRKAGTMPGPQLAECFIDDCTFDCEKCQKKVCEDAGQTCTDPDQSPQKTGDWTCTCPPPFTGAAEQQAAVCKIDECEETCDGCENDKCAAEEQTCVEPDPFTVGDWKCVCPPPAVAEAVMMAVASCDFDECKLHGEACTDVGQTCEDPDQSSRNDWMCVCVPPQTGQQGVGPASCKLDECAAMCDTCENGACGEQMCVDDQDLAIEVNTWKCVCPPPTAGEAIGGKAACLLDECKETCDTCENAQCGEQVCHEPNAEPTSTGDWYCSCPLPSTTVRVGGKAEPCEYNECSVPENEKVCNDVGQECVDPTPTLMQTNDWECHCVVPPANDAATAVMMPADCTYKGECETNDDAKKCVSEGHLCDDATGSNMLGDWECQCLPPATGPVQVGTSMGMVCQTNECEVVCPTCAKKSMNDVSPCELEGQRCVDTDLTTHSNWQCECIPPAVGDPVMLGAAQCSIDECAAAMNPCAGQTCVDTKQGVHETGDFECTCVEGVGVATGRPATCVCDECLTDGDTCPGPDPGPLQTCFDEDTSCPPKRDFKCVCTDPFHGTQVAGAAVCKVDECKDNGAVCVGEEQECVDPDEAVLDNWECRCPPPSVGTAVLAPAKCLLDECVLDCDTCEKDVCGPDQTCEDMDVTPQATGDWVCRCPPPSTNVKLGGRADCTIDECEENGYKCTEGCEPGSLNCMQTCLDPDVSAASLGDWRCVCPPGSEGGFAVGKPAECVPPNPCDCDTEDCCLAAGAVCDYSCEEPRRCVRKPCPGADEATCTRVDGCEWSQSGDGTAYVTGEAVVPFASGAAASCSGSVTVTVAEGYAPGRDALACVGCPGAAWDAAAGVLTLAGASATDVQKITFETLSAVGAPRKLAWQCGGQNGEVGLVRGYCEKRRCQHTDEETCSGDAYCTWVGGACEVNHCARHPSEVLCAKDPQCYFAATECPSMCREKRCPREFSTNGVVTTGEEDAACTADPQCRVETTDGTKRCVEKFCHDIEDRCECHEDPECYWSKDASLCVDKQYGACPTLDLVVLFDGSGSMSKQFGHHPHGFYALMATMREWLNGLPLSGERAGVPSTTLTEKIRVAFVQYSGTYDSVKAVRSPAGVGAGGRLSGDLGELMADLEWHEENYMAKQTFIAEGLQMTANVLDSSPQDGRRRAVYIISDGKLDDANRAGASLSQLRAADAQVFGIVVRRFEAQTDVDQQAEATLKPLTTAPQDEHFINIDMDHMAAEDNPLLTICDPTSQFGKFLAKPAGSMQPCYVYEEREACTYDIGCVWSETSQSCGNTPCLLNCDEATCNADTANGCSWDAAAQDCYKVPPCFAESETACAALAPECVWDMGRCVIDPCGYTTETGCLAQEEPACEWLCGENPPRCERKRCTGEDSGSCAMEAGCVWFDGGAGSGVCTVQACQYGDEATCVADGRCEWTGGACAVTACGRYPTEQYCSKDAACTFDYDVCPGVCKAEECPNGYCSCADVTDRCVCHEDPDCFWSSGKDSCVDKQYGACPTLDLVVLFDGSGSMIKQFGRHPHGFYALMATMREWVGGLPLSGEKAGVPSTTLTEKIRVAFVQYSGTYDGEKAVRSPAGVGAGGRLSGDRDELMADLEWHETNFMAKQTYIEQGLQMTAQVLKSSPQDGRRQAVFIISDGKLDDANRVGGALEKVRATRPEVFGIVVRRFAQQDDVDQAAEATLKPLTSAPQDEHFVNIDMDHMAMADGPLSTICDPTTPFGKFLAVSGREVPCSTHEGREACLKDAGCAWSDDTVRCAASSCAGACDAADCAARDGCAWDASNSDCKAVLICSAPTQGECEEDVRCLWDADDDACVQRPCTHTTEAACLSAAAPECVWDGQVCSVKECQYPSQDTCEAHAEDEQCEWKDATGCRKGTGDCVPEADNGCSCHPDEMACGAEPGCYWATEGVPVCKETYCRRTYATRGKFPEGGVLDGADAEARCDADPQCMATAHGDSDAKVCVGTACGDRTDKCSCRADDACYWNAATLECVGSQYGACPTLDLVVLFDGSGSMIKQFGRHPHGFYALVETMKQWAGGLPLSGEKAGAASTTLTEKLRVAFVQYSGTYDGEKARRAPAGVGAGGRLSGDAGELMADLDWHEANYMAKQTYIAEGLQMATEILQASPADGRRRAVFVISDGKLDDAGRIGTELEQLHATDAEVFGIVVRRFAQHTDEDLEAEATLKPLTSAPQDEHFINIDMDHMAAENGPLSTICDPTTPFGKFLAVSMPDGQKPCRLHAEADACVASSGCVWDEAAAACAPSVCQHLCTELSCVADEGCEWDFATKECGKRPPGPGETLCIERETEAACEDGTNKCQWDADEDRCIIHREHGTCADCQYCRWGWGAGTAACSVCDADTCGRCDCEGGWTGPECSVCFSKTPGSEECSVCTREATCSGHGDCAAGGYCTCDAGWGGADCSVPLTCSPAGAHWFTSYPNKPLAGEQFSLIVHGCFARGGGKGQKVRVVRGNEAASSQPHRELTDDEVAAICEKDVPTACSVDEAAQELVLGGEDCKAVAAHTAAQVEASAGMELMVNVTVAERADMHVCWYDAAVQKWALVATQRAGQRTAALEVVEDDGASGAGAVFNGAAGDEGCCDGWDFLGMCLPAALIIVLLLLLLSCLFLAYQVSRRSTNPDHDDRVNNKMYQANAAEAEGLEELQAVEHEDLARQEYKQGYEASEGSKSLLHGEGETSSAESLLSPAGEESGAASPAGGSAPSSPRGRKMKRTSV